MTAWLDARLQPFPPGPPPGTSWAAVQAWNWMGGQIDWVGLETIAEILGIDDVEGLVLDLVTIREAKRND